MSGEIPSKRQGHSAVLHGTTMWVYGGSTDEGYTNDLYSLNLENVNSNICNDREYGLNIMTLLGPNLQEEPIIHAF